MTKYQRLRSVGTLCLPIALGALLFAAGCGGGSNYPEDGDAPAKAGSSGGSTSGGATDDAYAGVPPEMAAAGVTKFDLAGPGQPPADFFNPDKRTVKPAMGGRVIQHIASEPANLNFMTENSAVIHWIHYDIHSSLIEFNPATWVYDPVLCTSYDIEDTIVLKGGRGDDNSNVLFGLINEDGDDYVVTSGSHFNSTSERRIPKSEVEELVRGSVFTFHLRENVKWHDGERFDADDVIFTMDSFKNPNVDCDEKRWQFDPVIKTERLSDFAVRFHYKDQYFAALQIFSDGFCILPSHLYNLSDPMNVDYDPNATAEAQGTYVNENPHNINWVGLGPYKLTKWEKGQYLEAERFDGFWNPAPEYAGYVDVIRWRYISDDNSAFQALLNKEVDIFDRVKSEDFVGEATESDVFKESFYKSYTYVGSIGFTVWNTYKPQFEDYRVRQALAYAFDADEWTRTNYQGLALRGTFSQFRFGPAYDQSVEPIPYDVTKAEELLTDAGWYDRDGNGVVDKDGKDLVINALMPTGNKASETLLQKMQEQYAQFGVKMTIQPLEWATFIERILDRDFDAANLAWTLNDIEGDPYGSWHKDEATFDRRTGNMAGYRDDVASDLIDRGRVELDPEKRYEIWHELHRRIYDQQPFLFGWNVPRKIAFNKDLRGVRLYKFSPGYRLRDFYYEEGTPGTRPLPGA